MKLGHRGRTGRLLVARVGTKYLVSSMFTPNLEHVAFICHSKKKVIWLYGSFPEMIRYRQFDLHPCRRCACVIDVPVGNRAWPSQNPCKSIDAPNDHERTCLTDGSGACYVVLSLMLSQLYIVIWIYNKLYTDHCYCYFVLMNITTITCYYYLFVYYNVVKKLYIYILKTLLFLLLLCYILLNPHCTIGGLPLDVHDVLSTSSTVLQQASHCQRQGAEASVGCWMITCGT